MDFRRRIRDLLSALLLTFLVGIVGYEWIEGWNLLDAAYMTVITLATIGYGETHPLSPVGRIFTIFLILSGISTFSYGLFSLTSLVAEGNLSAYLARKRMDKAISQLKDHYIVCGAGATGRHIIAELVRTGRTVVVVDPDPANLRRFETADTLRDWLGRGPSTVPVYHLEGDPAADKTLREANISQAAGLFCALPGDKDNLFVVLSARGLNPRLRLVAECQDEESTDKFRRAGADAVVSPDRIGGLRMASEMVRPTVVSFLDVMLRDSRGYRFEEVVLEADSPYLNRPLSQSPLRTTEGIRPVAVTAGGSYDYSPSDTTPLACGQRWVVLGRSEEVARLREALHRAG